MTDPATIAAKLTKALRPSREVIEKIERMEQANAVGWQAVRNMPLGSDILRRQS